jgi:hypothetical protein
VCLPVCCSPDASLRVPARPSRRTATRAAVGGTQIEIPFRPRTGRARRATVARRRPGIAHVRRDFAPGRPTGRGSPTRDGGRGAPTTAVSRRSCVLPHVHSSCCASLHSPALRGEPNGRDMSPAPIAARPAGPPRRRGALTRPRSRRVGHRSRRANLVPHCASLVVERAGGDEELPELRLRCAACSRSLRLPSAATRPNRAQAGPEACPRASAPPRPNSRLRHPAEQ